MGKLRCKAGTWAPWEWTVVNYTPMQTVRPVRVQIPHPHLQAKIWIKIGLVVGFVVIFFFLNDLTVFALYFVTMWRFVPIYLWDCNFPGSWFRRVQAQWSTFLSSYNCTLFMYLVQVAAGGEFTALIKLDTHQRPQLFVFPITLNIV